MRALSPPHASPRPHPIVQPCKHPSFASTLLPPPPTLLRATARAAAGPRSRPSRLYHVAPRPRLSHPRPEPNPRAPVEPNRPDPWPRRLLAPPHRWSCWCWCHGSRCRRTASIPQILPRRHRIRHKGREGAPRSSGKSVATSRMAWPPPDRDVLPPPTLLVPGFWPPARTTARQRGEEGGRPAAAR
jgi:hypothetical protein